ncbi:hypothetical protein D3C75_1113780 [compost metagenome]
MIAVASEPASLSVRAKHTAFSARHTGCRNASIWVGLATLNRWPIRGGPESSPRICGASIEPVSTVASLTAHRSDTLNPAPPIASGSMML